MERNKRTQKNKIRSLLVDSTTGDTLEDQADVLTEHSELISSSIPTTQTQSCSKPAERKPIRDNNRSNYAYDSILSTGADGSPEHTQGFITRP